MNEPSPQEYMEDFKFRCHDIIIKGGDLESVKKAILRKECPFLDCQFERDAEFRRMRRYYRKEIHNGLMVNLLKIIGEVEG